MANPGEEMDGTLRSEKGIFWTVTSRCPKWLPSTLSQLCTSHAGKLRLMPLAKDLGALVNSQRTSASPDVRR